MNKPTQTERDNAAAYVARHGRYMRAGVYSVRYPLHSAQCFIAGDTHELANQVAQAMADNTARIVVPVLDYRALRTRVNRAAPAARPQVKAYGRWLNLRHDANGAYVVTAGTRVPVEHAPKVTP